MKNYAELLKSPKWQKKRLEIMKRDKFTCQMCGSKTSTLNVHHCIYTKGLNPWDYNNITLLTLCEMCHNVEHKAKKFIKNCDIALSFGECGIPEVVLFTILRRLDKGEFNYKKLKKIGFGLKGLSNE